MKNFFSKYAYSIVLIKDTNIDKHMNYNKSLHAFVSVFHNVNEIVIIFLHRSHSVIFYISPFTKI